MSEEKVENIKDNTLSAEELKEKRAELEQKLKSKVEEVKAKAQEANEAMGQGKGILHLETPIKSGDTEVKELPYDFMALTGMEYTAAMDTDPQAQQAYRITYRQGLALFAQAAAKETDGLDMRDIIERIGATDAIEGVQLATLFFNGSTRAGRLRISKK